MTMAKARYYKTDGKKGRARKLPEWLFDGVVNEGVLHQAVKAYRANQRQGTGSAKNRSAVRGGSRKPWRQKGTGRARHGTIRSPIWEGGGVAFPPVPGSWRQRLPKKLKGLARRSALNSRAEDDRVILIDALEFDEPGTRRLVKYLEGIEVEGRVLLLTDGLKREVYLSGRNVQGLEIRPFGEESAYDVLMAGTVVIERSALERATEEAEKEPEAEAELGEDEPEEEPEAEAAEEDEPEAEPEAEAAEEEPEDEGEAEPETEAEEDAAAGESDEDEEKADA